MSANSVDQNTLPPSQDPAGAGATIEPPRDFLGILRRLGPGLIIAASIVGSGELVATTKTGAQAGILLLWLIIIGCVIKVFVQVELGRFAISHGESTLSALNAIPGPRFRVNWLVWYWCLMMLASLGQLGGIVGAVGQSLAISFPLTGDYLAVVSRPSPAELKTYVGHEAALAAQTDDWSKLSVQDRNRAARGHELLRQQLELLGEPGRELIERVHRNEKIIDPWTLDDRLWATIIAVITAWMLGVGRYGLIQNVSTVLVVGFTFITVGNVFSLQTTDRWAISSTAFLDGLSFRLPNSPDALGTALAAFGIIGVGASELVAYPYWCLEKGYARYAGQRSDDPEWARRAKGWVKVMLIDALVSMVVYTLATLAFFLMGAAVLHQDGRDPAGMRLVNTLAYAYVPVFGVYAKWLFLVGAFAVLYSTYLVANAGHARTITDAFKIFGVIDRDRQTDHDRSVKWLSILLPFVCLAVFLPGGDPVTMITISGMMQAFMLPMLSGAALYFRYTQTDSRLRPGLMWDICLALSSLAMLIAGAWGVWEQVKKFL